MKKIIAIIFILLIGLMVLGGCSNIDNKESKNQQGDTKGSDSNYQRNVGESASDDKLPEPPEFPK